MTNETKHNSFLSSLIRCFSFKGRIRRSNYCLSFLFYYACYFLIFSLSLNLSNNDNSNIAPLGLMVFLFFLLWFIIAQGTKRCHDLNHSGWWQIIPFYFLVMLFGDGDQYENDYGVDPKGRDIFGDS